MSLCNSRAGIAGLCWGLLLLAGCDVPVERGERGPLMALPDAWSGRTVETSQPELSSEWWWDYTDETARALVAEALAANPDLAGMGARLLQSVAAARLKTADREVTAGLGLSAGRSKNNFIGFPLVAGVPVIRSSSYELALDLSWEPDVWGRLAAGEQAAVSDVRAAAADLAGARLSLVGATLAAWYGLVEATAQRALAERTLAVWDRHAEVVERRHRSGLRSALDRRTVAANRAAAAAELSQRGLLEQAAIRSLEVLLGRYPSAELAATNSFPSLERNVPAGLPVELLQRRADLVAAEARLRSAELRVDEARADFYPQVTLSGSVGMRGEDPSDLFDDDFSVWSLFGHALQPLVDGDRLQSRWELVDARAAEAMAGFRSTLLAAVSEVETRLSAEAWQAETEAALELASQEADAALSLADDRYRSGLIELVTLLDSQRSAHRAAGALLSLRYARVKNRIELHLALGGGFDIAALGSEPEGTQ